MPAADTDAPPIPVLPAKDPVPLPPLFQWLQKEGNVDMQEMYRVFNCGIGMAVVVAEGDADAAEAALKAAGETVHRIGRIDARKDGEAQTIVG